jgi:hypothetical protein
LRIERQRLPRDYYLGRPIFNAGNAAKAMPYSLAIALWPIA